MATEALSKMGFRPCVMNKLISTRNLDIIGKKIDCAFSCGMCLFDSNIIISSFLGGSQIELGRIFPETRSITRSRGEYFAMMGASFYVGLSWKFLGVSMLLVEILRGLVLAFLLKVLIMLGYNKDFSFVLR